MQQPTHVWPETPTRSEAFLECRARIESPAFPLETLWYRVPEARGGWVTDSADPFLIGVLFLAMRRGGDLQIHGSVSPSLLRNLEEFQAAWAEWFSDQYRAVEIAVDNECEEEPSGSGRAALTFSGGLDSSFSAWRHTRGPAGRARVSLGAAVMAHGFDIPLAEEEMFARAAARSAELVGSLGIELVTVATNVREIIGDWPDATHGAALASCLHLLRRGFTMGLIASSHTYRDLRFPWGSNPVTDPLLSTAGFPISYDGAAFSRSQKARAVAMWPEAMTHLRVCWEGAELDRNCGVCAACVTTAVCFAVEGQPVPPSLRVASLEKAVHDLRRRPMKPITVRRLSDLVDAARSSGLDAPWVTALAGSVRHLRLVGVRHAIATRLRARLGVET